MVFSSSFDTTDALYHLKVESTNSTGKSLSFETKQPVTKFYDECGYLHRYLVRDLVDEAIQGFVR